MDLLLKNSDPVDASEPAMFLDVVDAVLEVAEPLGEVRLQQVAYQVFHVGIEVRRKPNLHSRNGLRPARLITITPDVRHLTFTPNICH